MTTLPQTAPVRSPRPLPMNGLAVGPGMPPGVAQASQQTGMNAADVMRILRANLWLILSMLIVSSIGGYALNTWLALRHSKYTSTGYLNVKNDHPDVLDGRLFNPGADGTAIEVEQHTNEKLLTHERLLSTVLEQSNPVRQTDWFKQFVYYKNGAEQVDAESAKYDLAEHLEVNAIPNSRLLQIRMSYSIPKDCQTIVQEIVDAHIKMVRSANSMLIVESAKELEAYKQNLESKLRLNSGQMLKIATELGNVGISIGSGGNSKEFELNQLIVEQLRAHTFLGAAIAKLNTFDQQMQTSSAPELEEALQKSALYSEYRRAVDELNLSYNDNVVRLGKDHQQTIALKHRMDAMSQKLADTENDIKSRTADLIRANLLNDKSGAEAALKRIDDRMSAIRIEIADYATKRNEYQRLEADSTTIREALDKVKDRQDKIGYSNNGKWSQVDWATLPDLPDHPTFPKLWVTLPLAILVGLTLSLGIAFLREILDTTVRTPRDIARIGQLTLLGMIPHEADDPQAAGSRLPLAIFEAPHSIIAEQFRHLRTRLQHTTSLDTTRSILVTGCSPEDGKTMVACNLASGLALNGRRILLVDANFRRPNLHNIFAPSTEIGFGDVLNDLEVFEDAVQETEVPNLSVIIAGQRPSNPTELLESQLLVDFIERALEEYDHVIFDSGPLLMVSDSIALAPRVDGVITVVRARGNSRGMLTRMRDELRRLKAEHLGVVLNAVRVHGGGYYNAMIKSYYAYQTPDV